MGARYPLDVSDDPLDVSDPGSPAGDDDTLDDPQDLLDRVKRAQALHGEGDVGDDSPSATGEASADPETSEEPDDDHTVIPDEATMSRLRLSLTESRAQAESDLSSKAEHTIAGGGVLRRSRR